MSARGRVAGAGRRVAEVAPLVPDPVERRAKLQAARPAGTPLGATEPWH